MKKLLIAAAIALAAVIVVPSVASAQCTTLQILEHGNYVAAWDEQFEQFPGEAQTMGAQAMLADIQDCYPVRYWEVNALLTVWGAFWGLYWGQEYFDMVVAAMFATLGVF